MGEAVNLEGIGRLRRGFSTTNPSFVACFMHPTHVRGIQARVATRANQNKFPFSANVASLMVIEAVQLLITAKQCRTPVISYTIV